MKIGIDTSMLVYQGSGVATYTYNLVKSLLENHPEHSYHLFYSSLRRPKHFNALTEFRKMGANVHEYRFPPTLLRFAWNEHSLFPVEWFIGKVDVFHSSDYLRPPLNKNTKPMTTLHDLTWKLFPEFHTPDVIEAHTRKIAMTIKGKDIILADSENTKNDLLKLYPAATNNTIHVLYLGVEKRYRSIEDKNEIAKVLKKYNIDYPKRYILYVGAIEPRKNVDRSVKIFAELVKQKGYEDMEYLIIGRAGWKNEHVFKTIQESGVKDKVKFVGYVPDEDLPYFYNGALSLMYLSSYEGFGLPPVEAAKCGTPTLMYNNSSLKEIMPKTYEFAEENNELQTLQQLISEKETGTVFTSDVGDWKTYADRFIEIAKS